MRFFTADQHFGHINILKYQTGTRQFQTINEMNARLVELWNAVVSNGDEVYCLGDFSFKQSIAAEILPKLNGRKILIAGNHDPFFKRLNLAGKTKMLREAHEDAVAVGFNELTLEMVIDIEGIGKVRLNHFPYANPEGEPEFERHTHLWPKPGSESLLLHGHVHSKWRSRTYTGMPPMLNVGLDVHQLNLLSEQDVVRFFNEQGLLVGSID